jgi:hypothetical protein
MAESPSFPTQCLSARAFRLVSAAALISLALAAAGCGDDDEGRVEQDTASTSTSPSTTPTDTSPAETAAETETDVPTVTEGSGSGGGGTGGAAPGEEQEGGAGDEVEASSQALFTGRGGKITPRLVRVPPFIAIRVELRAADRRVYELRARGRRVRADADVSSASTSFAGLRPGKRLVLTGPAGRVVVEASAEPGP